MNKRNITLVAIALADLLAAIDTTGVNVAVPQIARHLHITPLAAQWVPNAYSLAMVSLLIFAGKVGDRLGHRKLFLWGLTVFALGSLGCGLSSTVLQLTALRFIQGIGGAILYTCGWALIAHLWEDREKAFAVTAAFFSLGVVIGPPLAGWLAGLSIGQFAGWHLVFLINVPIIAAAIFLAAKFTPAVPADRSARASLLSVGLMVFCVMLFVQALSHPRHYLAWVGAGILALGIIVSEQFTSSRLVDTSVFRNRTFTAANAVSLLIMMVVSGFSYVATFHMQYTLGYSSLTAGLCMLPVPLFMVVFAGVGSQIRQWRLGAVSSSILIVIGLLWLIVQGGAGSYWKGFFVAFSLLGAGGGLLMTSVVSAVMGSAPPAKAGTASGLLNTLQQIGALVGVAAVAGIVGNFRLAVVFLTVLGIGALACSALIERRDIVANVSAHE